MNVKHIEVGLNSNIGLRRKDNQDSACAGNGVYVVCDGMGGGKGGKQASSDVAGNGSRVWPNCRRAILTRLTKR